jgi:DNA (cytosine-5)-methyltransferase 1
VLTEQQIRCINHWNQLIQRLPEDIELPSFPIWGDEIVSTYPFEKATPHATPIAKLRKHVGWPKHVRVTRKAPLLARLPSYARTPQRRFPNWKVAFIRDNRRWSAEISEYLTQRWIENLQRFPASLRKLEWNCQGEVRDLWEHVLQFRPSGLRVKRYVTCPALVAMTTTQIPLLGPKRRFLTRIEGLRVQGFPDAHVLPKKREDAFKALGNAVHVGVATVIAARVFRD